jgi:5-methylthioadenosine/S-adenosylhomocysteine deaminase
VGSLEPGKDADLTAFPLNVPAAAPAYDPAASLVFALGGHPACFVSVAGRVLVDDGRILVGDQASATRVARTAASLADWQLRHRHTAP